MVLVELSGDLCGVEVEGARRGAVVTVEFGLLLVERCEVSDEVILVLVPPLVGAARVSHMLSRRLELLTIGKRSLRNEQFLKHFRVRALLLLHITEERSWFRFLSVLSHFCKEINLPANQPADRLP